MSHMTPAAEQRSNPRPHRANAERATPVGIRRRYGYPAPYRGPVEDVLAELAALRERLDRLEAHR